MAQNRESFNKVKDILRKLDHSIDEARAKRIEEEDGSPPATSTKPNTGNGAATPLRARPLPRRDGQPDPNERWIGSND
jgi:hypothetical protein